MELGFLNQILYDNNSNGNVDVLIHELYTSNREACYLAVCLLLTLVYTNKIQTYTCITVEIVGELCCSSNLQTWRMQLRTNYGDVFRQYCLDVREHTRYNPLLPQNDISVFEIFGMYTTLNNQTKNLLTLNPNSTVCDKVSYLSIVLLLLNIQDVAARNCVILDVLKKQNMSENFTEMFLKYYGIPSEDFLEYNLETYIENRIAENKTKSFLRLILGSK